MNLHDRDESVALVKAALAKDNGVAVFHKGDVAGHEFHGNQYKDGGAAAQKAHAATKRAVTASILANSHTQFNLHEQAMNAHKDAADLHNVAGHAQMAALHTARAAEHATRIKELRASVNAYLGTK
jgi:hypothetical protein